MSNLIKIKRSAVPGKSPSVANLALGELAINTYGGRIFFKKLTDGVEEVIPVGNQIDSAHVLDQNDFDGNTLWSEYPDGLTLLFPNNDGTFPVSSAEVQIQTIKQDGYGASQLLLGDGNRKYRFATVSTGWSSWTSIAGASAGVNTVNGMDGDVVIDYTHVGADPSGAAAAVQANLDSEATTRATADTTLQTNIDAVQANLDAETTARGNADATLQSNIDAEASTRAANDATLQANLDAEEAARLAAELVLTQNLAAEEAARIAADLVLQGNIDTEAAARLAGDAALQTYVDSVTGDLATHSTENAYDIQALYIMHWIGVK